MDFRTFPDAVEAICQQWRDEVLTTLSWKVAGSSGQLGGEAQGFHVRSGTVGGYAKPGRNQPPVARHPRAAHEKIAADLAFDLRLPVPPAVLWDRGKVGAQQERYLSVAHLAFVPAFTWGQIEHQRPLVQQFDAQVSTCGSAMSAFDTWVGNTDRVNRNNILVQLDDTRDPPLARVAFIDYANSLSYSWRVGDGWMRSEAAQWYPTQVAPDLGAMAEGIGRIEALDAGVIEEVVGRIPSGFLTEECRNVTLQGLRHRKGVLREIMKTRYPGLA